MGTIAQKLTYLEDTKTRIGNAITAKGGSVTGKTFRQYATEISNLPSGGGGTPIAESVDVSDYTGGTSFNLLAQITDVNWPSGITSIGGSAFYHCTGLTSLTIPNSVTSIGISAFNDCTGLTSLTIGSGVASIGNQVFKGCTGLTSVTIPDSVTSIGGQAFYGCSRLTSVTIPDSVTSIEQNAFNYCTGLTSITVEATTPPTLANTNAFNNTNNCPIYVPAESVDTYKAASNWSSLASRIQAIPSE